MEKIPLKLLMVITALIVAGGGIFLSFRIIPSKVMVWENKSDPISAAANIVRDIVSENDMTILVLGKPGAIGGQTVMGEQLTDTIMVVNFNSKTNVVSLISIPRDLWLSDGNEQFKINEMMVRHKIGSVAGKIEEITGLNLDGYMIVDLDLVKNAIDYLGGVDVTLSRPAVDWVSGYTLSTGVHHLNGDDAIWLIRNRYDKEGDFFRERNQQQIMADLFSRFKNLSAGDKVVFINKFVVDSRLLENSDLDMAKLTGYALNSDLSKVTVNNIVLDFTTKLFKTEMLPVTFVTSTKNISILIPSEGFEKYDQISSYIRLQLTK